MMPATTALSPVAWAVSELAGPRMIEMTDKMTNPANENVFRDLSPWPLACFTPGYYSQELTPKPGAVQGYPNEFRHPLRTTH